MKVIELFGGIGACSKALKRLSIQHEIVDYVEIDKYAVNSYNAMNGTNFEPQDITKWNKDIDVDLIMHGSPCQDFSLAGKGAGGDECSGTRSSLMYETIRIVEKLKPTYVVWENVKNVISKKHKHNFNQYIHYLNELGYISYFKVLNAKDYGVPQNRERVFIVSIRKDVDDGLFHFPTPFELKLRLKDMLEDKVDEKYYLSKVLNARFTENYIQYDNSGKGYNSQAARLYYQDGLCPTLPNRNSGDKSQVILADKKVVKSLFTETQAQMITHDGNVKRYLNSDVVDEFKEGQAADISFPNGYGKGKRTFDVCPALNTTTTSSSFITKISQTPIIIRKLTPKECFRLMGFDDVDYEKASSVNSNTQLYKQAGNSIVVNVLEEIFKMLLGA